MHKTRGAEKLLELGGWLVIVGAFVGIGVGAVFVLSFLLGGLVGLFIGILMALVITGLGIYAATRAYKGKGTLHALFRTRASPDLDSPGGEE